MRTVLITGVTGQLGSYLADFYLSNGDKVVGFSRRTATHSTARIDHLMDNPQFEYLEGDITDTPFLLYLLARVKPDFCVNAAAQSHVHTSFEQPSSTWDITAKGAMSVIDAIRLASPSTRLVQMSTSEMFGSSYDQEQAGFIGGDFRIHKYQDENTKHSPQSPYAIAKMAAHEYTKLMRRTHNLHLSILIAFNFESPRRGDNFVTQKIVRWFKAYKKWLNLYKIDVVSVSADGNYLFGKDAPPMARLRLGNLDAYRDWSYVKDVVRAIDLILNSDKPDEYVVGTGESHSVREFLYEVSMNILGHGDFNQYVVIDPAFYRPAEVDYLCAKPDKIKRDLRWSPTVGFEELVSIMCEVQPAK